MGCQVGAGGYAKDVWDVIGRVHRGHRPYGTPGIFIGALTPR